MVGTFLGRRDKGASTSTTGNKEGLACTWRIKGEIDDALPFGPSLEAPWLPGCP